MKIQIKKSDIPVLEDILGSEDAARDFLRTVQQRLSGGKGTSLALDIDLPDDVMAKLKAGLADAGNRSLLNQFNLYDRMKLDANVKISRLVHLKDAVVGWILKDCSKGWLFQEKDGQIQAYVVSGITNQTPMHGEPYVEIRLDANMPQKEGQNERVGAASIKIHQSDLPSTVSELLANGGYMHETPELHAEYEKMLKRFGEVADQPSAQFRLKPGTYKPTTGYTNLVLTRTHRCINDETLLKRHIRSDAEYSFWETSGKRTLNPPAGAFTEIPMHFMHLVYDLEVHQEFWAPTAALTEYVYDEEAATKIVLPDDHRELIDILTEDEDVLIEDVVENKSGGNLVLLQGAAGLGKTLLAEIYSEKMKRPLYRLPASYLGLDAATVEKQLAVVYANAARWNAVTLVDEADIYIRRRDNDMVHNSVVGAMLIALERQNVLTFMATNRVNDVDEAIESRCIAIVNFEYPENEDAAKIWEIQSKHIGLNLEPKVIADLVSHYGGKGRKTAGRDIRALLKLAYRYQLRRNIKPDFNRIVQLGAFKGF